MFQGLLDYFKELIQGLLDYFKELIQGLVFYLAEMIRLVSAPFFNMVTPYIEEAARQPTAEFVVLIILAVLFAALVFGAIFALLELTSVRGKKVTIDKFAIRIFSVFISFISLLIFSIEKKQVTLEELVAADLVEFEAQSGDYISYINQSRDRLCTFDMPVNGDTDIVRSSAADTFLLCQFLNNLESHLVSFSKSRFLSPDRLKNFQYAAYQDSISGEHQSRVVKKLSELKQFSEASSDASRKAREDLATLRKTNRTYIVFIALLGFSAALEIGSELRSAFRGIWRSVLAGCRLVRSVVIEIVRVSKRAFSYVGRLTPAIIKRGNTSSNSIDKDSNPS